MNINATLIGQTITFMVFVWFCMKYIWPHIMSALAERQQKIADGLAAAERGKQQHELAEKRAEERLKEAKGQATEIIARADKRAADIVDEAKSDARTEGQRLLEVARGEIDQEMQRAKEELRSQVATLAVAGAGRILGKEMDAAGHAGALDDLVKQL